MRPARVAIGRITRSHGIRGEIRVESLTDHRDRLAGLTSVTLVRNGVEIGDFAIESWRPLGEDFGLKLRGIDTPEAVTPYRGAEVQAEPRSAAELPTGTFYVFDLVGLDVRTEDGAVIGTIAGVERYPANDVLIVRAGNAEHLLPFVAEVIRGVDLDARTVTVHPLPGLLEP